MEAKIKGIDEQLRYFEIPQRIRDAWEIGHGWPRIAQSLSLESKLGKDTHEQLGEQFRAKMEELMAMVPEYPDYCLLCKIRRGIKKLLE